MIVGLDVSTSIIGVCFLDDDGSFVESSFVDLRKEKDFTEKCLMFAKHVEKFSQLHEVDNVFIEDKLSGFARGRTSQQTIMKLAAFNGACTYIAGSVFSVSPLHVHPSTVKATMKKDGLFIPKGADKKRASLDFVCSTISDFPYEETRNGNPQVFCFDMVDAYCVARAGYLKHICEESKN